MTFSQKWLAFLCIAACPVIARAEAPALATSDTVADLIKTPTNTDMGAAYPAAARAAHLPGRVTMRCRVETTGALDACEIVSETPVGADFGAAALKLSTSFQMKPATHAGAPIASTVTIPIAFGLRGGPTKGDTGPSWIKTPSADQLEAVFPRKAVIDGRQGKAIIRCIATVTGVLSNCKVVSESPQGYGFGGAALLLSARFLMKPASRNGIPVEGEVTIPINFAISGGGGGSRGGDEMFVKAWYPWIKAPSADQLAAVYPSSALAKTLHGHVVLRCGFKRDMTLRDCDDVSEQPRSMGFSRAAKSLAKDFQGSPDLIKPADLDKTYVDLAIDMTSPGPPGAVRYINEPDWTRSLDPAHVAKLFPSKAVDAKITTGHATLDCLIGDHGALIQCRAVSEAPQNMDFGTVATFAAQAMAVNLWTRDGSPTPGAHIRLPISLVYAGEQAATPRSSGSSQAGAHP